MSSSKPKLQLDLSLELGLLLFLSGIPDCNYTFRLLIRSTEELNRVSRRTQKCSASNSSAAVIELAKVEIGLQRSTCCNDNDMNGGD